MSNIEWISLIGADLSPKIHPFQLTQVEDHPLKPATMVHRRIFSSNPSTGGRTTPISTPTAILDISSVLDGIDPLTQFANEQLDPLTQMSAEEHARRNSKDSDMVDFGLHSSRRARLTQNGSDVTGNLWKNRKRRILEQFTTSQRLTIVTSFLTDGEKITVKQVSDPGAIVQQRLEQLDQLDLHSQRRYDLSQAEYCARIQQLGEELEAAWRAEGRVRALKIAIQCAKLLADATEAITFYPSKFVLITEILDTFGGLIYERLRTKSDCEIPGSKSIPPLPEHFTPDMVSEPTKETCRNWFYKIASIRELVPRIYVEMAILKSYSFLTSSEYHGALLRLTHMIRGVGNPLVAAYARAYLSRVGLSVTGAGPNQQYLIENYYDFVHIYPHIFNRVVLFDVEKQNVSREQYLSLYCPALEYILEVAAINATDRLLPEVLEKCRSQGNSLLLLHTVLVSFPTIALIPRTLHLVDMIGDSSSDDAFPAARVLTRLGQVVGDGSTLQTDHQRQILNLVWRYMATLSKPEEYIKCVDAWIEFAVKRFQIRELNLIIGDVIKRLKTNQVYEEHYSELQSIIEKIVANIQDFDGFLTMDHFLPFMDLFNQPRHPVRTNVYKHVISSYLSHTPSPTSQSTPPLLQQLLQSQQSSMTNVIHDPIAVNALLHLGSALHDDTAAGALVVLDERRQLGELLAQVVRRVYMDDGEERMLTWYVEVRGVWSQLDAVLSQLVQCVNALSVKVRQQVQGLHNRKTGAFVRACAAYCFITIPSIESVRNRLELYLLSGQVALFNYCLGQADACFKAALSLISDIPNDTSEYDYDAFLLGYVRTFLSTLLVVPDSPDRGVLSLMRVLVNTLQKYPWKGKENSLISLYLSVLDVLHAMGQETYAYHIDKVDSNDTLYGSDPKFLIELNKMSSIILSEILSQLQLCAGKQQSGAALELILRLALKSDLSNIARVNLAENLWNLALKNMAQDSNNAEAMRLKNYLIERSTSSDNRHLKDLISKLTIIK